MMKTGTLNSGIRSRKVSAAFSRTAPVSAGCDSSLMSGSLFMCSTAAGSREKSALLRLKICRCGVIWLIPLISRAATFGIPNVEREALADQPGHLVLVLERVIAGDHAPCAVPEN